MSYHADCAGDNWSMSGMIVMSLEWGGLAVFTEELVCLYCVQRLWVHGGFVFSNFLFPRASESEAITGIKAGDHQTSQSARNAFIFLIFLLCQKCDWNFKHGVILKALSLVGHCLEVSKPASWVLLLEKSSCQLFKIRILKRAFLWGLERCAAWGFSRFLWSYPRRVLANFLACVTEHLGFIKSGTHRWVSRW